MSYRPAVCQCGEELEATECPYCGGEGFSYHDCGEDTCACRDPLPNVRCNECRGTGYIETCPACYVGEDYA